MIASIKKWTLIAGIFAIALILGGIICAIIKANYIQMMGINILILTLSIVGCRHFKYTK